MWMLVCEVELGSCDVVGGFSTSTLHSVPLFCSFSFYQTMVVTSAFVLSPRVVMLSE